MKGNESIKLLKGNESAKLLKGNEFVKLLKGNASVRLLKGNEFVKPLKGNASVRLLKRMNQLKCGGVMIQPILLCNQSCLDQYCVKPSNTALTPSDRECPKNIFIDLHNSL